MIFIHRQKVWHLDEDGKPYLAYVGTATLVRPARRLCQLEAAVPEKLRELFAEGSVAEDAEHVLRGEAIKKAVELVPELCPSPAFTWIWSGGPRPADTPT